MLLIQGCFESYAFLHPDLITGITTLSMWELPIQNFPVFKEKLLPVIYKDPEYYNLGILYGNAI